MLLRRSPERIWRVDEIAAALGMSRAIVTTCVDGLARNGVVAVETKEPTGDADRVRYQPASVALHAGVESLVAAYQADPLPVVKAVLDRPPRALRTFSDAFLFRRRRD